MVKMRGAVILLVSVCASQVSTMSSTSLYLQACFCKQAFVILFVSDSVLSACVPQVSAMSTSLYLQVCFCKQADVILLASVCTSQVSTMSSTSLYLQACFSIDRSLQ